MPGRFLLGTGKPNANSYDGWGQNRQDYNMPVGETGGTYHHTITIEEMPSHRHSLKEDQIGDISFSMLNADFAYGSNWYGNDQYHLAAKKDVADPIASIIAESQLQTRYAIENVGDSKEIQLFPPYYTVIMWERKK